MATKYFGIPTWGMVAGVAIVVAAAIVVSEPQIAWNSGARERLSAALRAVGRDLASGQANLADFVAHQINHDSTRDLASRHGITVKWHGQRGYEEILFYPIAVSSKIDLDRSLGRRPQVVMVPVESSEVAALPTLFQCMDCPEDKMKECQLRAMKKAFASRHIDSAATLMSDMSVVYVRAPDLFDGRSDE